MTEFRQGYIKLPRDKDYGFVVADDKTGDKWFSLELAAKAGIELYPNKRVQYTERLSQNGKMKVDVMKDVENA